jgi:cysteinyl-tRNA synthetase
MYLKLYNSLTKKTEEFQPITTKQVSMYVCGPTVYDRPHIGNARSVVIYDLLYRVLCNQYGKNKVNYIRNITDVDDKIVDASLQRDISINSLTATIYQQFTADMEYLNCLAPSKEPKATENIAEMIKMIEILLQKNYAYLADNHVFFDVLKFTNYTKLSGRSLEELESGYRIDINHSKKHSADFVLWKPSKENEPDSAKFDSPWGKGRPGWHIECSAMSTKYLGKNFDIHGGGIDLIFPHHTNEIAQSCCAYDHSSYAHYWVHNGFVTVDGEKMSKSLGNFITVHDLENKKINGESIRYYLLSTHYRKPLNWTQKGIDDSSLAVQYLHRVIEENSFNQNSDLIDNEIIAALNDDLNTPIALAKLHEIAKNYHKAISQEEKSILATKLLNSGKLLGLFFNIHNSKQNISPEIIEQINIRNEAKKLKNWELADKIRNELKNKGILLEDTPDGKTKWKYE